MIFISSINFNEKENKFYFTIFKTSGFQMKED